VVIERRPVRRSEVEIALDADAVKKVGHQLAFGSGLDDLKVADEAGADVALRLVHFDGAACAGERDGCSKTRRSGAGDADGVGHQSRYVIAPCLQ